MAGSGVSQNSLSNKLLKIKLAITFGTGLVLVILSFLHGIFVTSSGCIYPSRKGSSNIVKIDAKPEFVFGRKVEDSHVCVQDDKQRSSIYCNPGQSMPWKYTGYKTNGGRLRMFVNGTWFPFGEKNTPKEDIFTYKPYIDYKNQGGGIIYTYQKSNDYKKCKMTSDIVYADTDQKRLTNLCRYESKSTQDSTSLMYKFTDYAVGIHLKESDIKTGKFSLDELEFEPCAMERGYGVYVKIGDEDTEKAYHVYNPLVYSYTEFCKDGVCKKQFLSDTLSKNFIKATIPFSLPFQTATPRPFENSSAAKIFSAAPDSKPIIESEEKVCVQEDDPLLAYALGKSPEKDQKIYVNFANVNYEDQDGEIEIFFAEGVKTDEALQPRRLGLAFLSKIIYDVLNPLFGQHDNVKIGEVAGFTSKEGGFLVEARNSLISNSAIQTVKILSIVLWLFTVGYGIVVESRTVDSVKDDLVGGAPFFVLILWALNPESYVFFDDILIPLYLQVLNGISTFVVNLFSNFVSIYPDTKNPLDFLDVFIGEFFSTTTLFRMFGLATSPSTILVFVGAVSPMIVWGMMHVIEKIFSLVINFTLSTIQVGIMFLLFPLCAAASIHPATRPAMTKLFDQILGSIIDFARNTGVTTLLIGIPIYFYDRLFNFVVCYKEFVSWAFDIFGYTLFDIKINTWQVSEKPDIILLIFNAALFCLICYLIDAVESLLEKATSGVGSGSEFAIGANVKVPELQILRDIASKVKASFTPKQKSAKATRGQDFGSMPSLNQASKGMSAQKSMAANGGGVSRLPFPNGANQMPNNQAMANSRRPANSFSNAGRSFSEGVKKQADSLRKLAAGLNSRMKQEVGSVLRQIADRMNNIEQGFKRKMANLESMVNSQINRLGIDRLIGIKQNQIKSEVSDALRREASKLDQVRQKLRTSDFGDQSESKRVLTALDKSYNDISQLGKNIQSSPNSSNSSSSPRSNNTLQSGNNQGRLNNNLNTSGNNVSRAGAGGNQAGEARRDGAGGGQSNTAGARRDGTGGGQSGDGVRRDGAGISNTNMDKARRDGAGGGNQNNDGVTSRNYAQQNSSNSSDGVQNRPSLSQNTVPPSTNSQAVFKSGDFSPATEPSTSKGSPLSILPASGSQAGSDNFNPLSNFISPPAEKSSTSQSYNSYNSDSGSSSSYDSSEQKSSPSGSSQTSPASYQGAVGVQSSSAPPSAVVESPSQSSSSASDYNQSSSPVNAVSKASEKAPAEGKPDLLDPNSNPDGYNAPERNQMKKKEQEDEDEKRRREEEEQVMKLFQELFNKEN